MKLKATLVVTVLTLLSSQVQARELVDWMASVLKVENPNELAVYVQAGKDCPFTTDELKEIASGVLIRSRVKPLVGNEWFENSLYLSGKIDCFIPDTSRDYQAFSIKIYYGNYSAYPPVSYPYEHGGVGMGAKDLILSSYKEGIEAAITDYIKANFNL